MYKKGYSALEVVIVIGIVAVVAGVILAPVSGFRAAQDLNNSADRIVAMLSEARSKTVASNSDSRFGVHFEAGSATLFRGDAYSEGDGENVVYLVPDRALVETALQGGASDVLFNRLTGGTQRYGTVTLRSVADPGDTKAVTINQYGIVEIE